MNDTYVTDNIVSCIEYKTFLTRLIYLDFIFVIYKLHKNYSNNIIEILSFDFLINFMISGLSLYSIYNYNLKCIIMTYLYSIITSGVILHNVISTMKKYCVLYINNLLNISILEHIITILNYIMILMIYLYMFLVNFNFINGIYNLSDAEYNLLISSPPV